MATPEKVTKVHDMVMGGRGVTERYITSAAGVSRERAYRRSGYENSVHWVPRLLTVDLKQTRQNMLHNLNLFKTDPDKFLLRFFYYR